MYSINYFPTRMVQLPPPQITHGFLSEILTISGREERCQGMQIEGDRYHDMGLAGALTVAQLVASFHYPRCRARYHCFIYPAPSRIIPHRRS